MYICIQTQFDIGRPLVSHQAVGANLHILQPATLSDLATLQPTTLVGL